MTPSAPLPPEPRSRTAQAELALELLQSEPLATTIGLHDLARLRAECRDTVTTSTIAVATIDTLCGPAPGPLGAQLRLHLRLGAAQFRHAADTITALLRARQSSPRLSTNPSAPLETPDPVEGLSIADPEPVEGYQSQTLSPSKGYQPSTIN